MTANYDLKLLKSTDKVDYNDFNSNFNLVDTELLKLQTAMNVINSFDFIKVETEAEVTEERKLYFVGTKAPYDEYVLMDGVPEYIGSTKITISNYLTKASAETTYVKIDGDKVLSEVDFTQLLADKLDSLSNYDDTEVKDLIASKVAVVEGKTLTSNDFTNALKQKLDGLTNYDDTSILTSIDNKVDKVEGKDLSTNDFTDALKDKLDNLTSGSGDGEVVKGDKGDPGEQGEQGIPGVNGATFTPILTVVDDNTINLSFTNDKELDNPTTVNVKGAKGDKGLKGEPGADGTMTFDDLTDEQKASLKGDKGDKGNAGDQGETGETPTITAGTTTTLNASEQARVTVDETSTDTNVIFNFAIPRGYKGEQGEPGVGNGSSYDDTALQEKIATLETKITELETLINNIDTNKGSSFGLSSF